MRLLKCSALKREGVQGGAPVAGLEANKSLKLSLLGKRVTFIERDWLSTDQAQGDSSLAIILSFFLVM
jgi:hypothetical protein